MPNVYNLRTNIPSSDPKRPITVGKYFEQVTAAQIKKADDFAGRFSRHPRSAWLVTCKNWIYKGEAPIRLYVNPSQVQWSLPRRGMFTKTAAGTTRNIWRNRYRDTQFDEFTLNITFQGGNIMPFMGYADAPITMDNLVAMLGAPQMPPGIANLYRFLELCNQPALAGKAGQNYHILQYHSRLFPRMELTGFFQDDVPIVFTEDANNGNTVSWTATFLVYDTYPKISSEAQLTSVYEGWLGDEGMAEAIPWNNTFRDDALFTAAVSPPTSKMTGTFPNSTKMTGTFPNSTFTLPKSYAEQAQDILAGRGPALGPEPGTPAGSLPSKDPAPMQDEGESQFHYMGRFNAWQQRQQGYVPGSPDIPPLRGDNEPIQDYWARYATWNSQRSSSAGPTPVQTIK